MFKKILCLVLIALLAISSIGACNAIVRPPPNSKVPDPGYHEDPLKNYTNGTHWKPFGIKFEMMSINGELPHIRVYDKQNNKLTDETYGVKVFSKSVYHFFEVDPASKYHDIAVVVTALLRETKTIIIPAIGYDNVTIIYYLQNIDCVFCGHENYYNAWLKNKHTQMVLNETPNDF